jgi:5'-nucleotidase
MRPLILISNDDGIESPYLLSLADALEARSGGEVFVIAPERQRSAMSHTITLHKPLRVEQRGQNRLSASGSPVDCVYLGLIKLAPRPPALVISGINDGYNLGTDVFYSGTVGAAIEGGLRGVPSIAVSLAHGSPEELPAAVELVVALARAALADPHPPGTVLNVNVPAGSAGRYRWTCLGRRHYGDDVQERLDPRGRTYFWIGGGDAWMEDIAGSDCEAVSAGLVSITPLKLDLTAHELLGESRPTWTLDGYELVAR